MNYMTEDHNMTDRERNTGKRYVWECAIGGRDAVTIPPGGDLPMRKAVEKAFFEVTGQPADYTYSGWGRKFTDKAWSVAPPSQRRTPHGVFVAMLMGACLTAGFAVGYSL